MERLPGFRDFYPEPTPAQDAWSAEARHRIFSTWRDAARRYGFREYDGPPLEPLELFTTKSGEEIVKQLFDFEDKGGRRVALRPEMTPTLARMIAAHERSYRKPIKWFSIPQLFRYEKQQKGRLREHFQFNADIVGEPGVAADAELIALLIDTLRLLGLTPQDFVIRLSSRHAWQDFYRTGNGDPAREYEFFQAVDKLERMPPEESADKLKSLGFDAAAVSSFIETGAPTPELQSLLDNLAARGMGEFVKVDYHVIRGLAYYTGIVFEAFDCKGEFRAIAGGGRYDNLIALISGGKVNLPALGFGMGDVVLLELLKSRGLPLGESAHRLDAFVVVPEESLRSEVLRIVTRLRAEGISADYTLMAAKPDKQFKRAQDLKARFVVTPMRDSSNTLNFKVKAMEGFSESVLTEPEALAVFRRKP